MTYYEFLKQKEIRTLPTGFDSNADNPKLFDWQNAIVRWALKKGRAAVFADCGLGKTAVQLQWAYEVAKHENRPVLVVAPLAVAAQTKQEGEKFNIPVTVCRKQEHVNGLVNITNYEMLDYFEPEAFCGVVLDESSILKSYTGTTKRKIVSMFDGMKYKLSCSATPAPNDLMELLNQAEFLGVMKSNEALSCWFIADQTNSGHYRLKGHAAHDFWRWVASWAICMETPEDIGYDGSAYILPSMHETTEIVRPEYEDGLQEMFEIASTLNMSATGFHNEKKKTVHARCERCADIAQSTDDQYLIWCYRNDESELLKKLLPEAVEVKGSDSVEHKEQAALDFAQGKTRVLISKASIFGYGLNFQKCHKMIFCGLDYSFESYYQAVRRVYRFGQKSEVDVVKVIGENEKNILETIARKEEMKKNMSRSMASSMKMFQSEELNGRQFKLDLDKQVITFPSWVRTEAV